ncbi:hypothetical protein FGO68_gene407 [Halteria grandinella]|uniref:Transmembrane protein n=1 Tax=Halteria grandinella TaxID=5974 RepID=A0A8J8SWP4_HALGN|nr:hypothetical protein FGO68_gene407 [Halteria grandinella]
MEYQQKTFQEQVGGCDEAVIVKMFILIILKLPIVKLYYLIIISSRDQRGSSISYYQSQLWHLKAFWLSTSIIPISVTVCCGLFCNPSILKIGIFTASQSLSTTQIAQKVQFTLELQAFHGEQWNECRLYRQKYQLMHRDKMHYLLIPTFRKGKQRTKFASNEEMKNLKIIMALRFFKFPCKQQFSRGILGVINPKQIRIPW